MATKARTPQGRRTQRERSEATTGQLLAAARHLFATDGYAATSLDAVVAEAGVTKGAVYHHFRGKAELFEAVYEHEQARLSEELARAFGSKADPVEGAYAACRAFLDASMDQGVQRITLLDAPSALGWERMREIEAEYGLALIKSGIKAAIDAKRIARRDVDSLAHLLFGALCEGAMYVVRADDPALARRRFEREVKALLDALAA